MADAELYMPLLAGQIRLLECVPGDGIHAVSCKLRVVDLGSNPEYITLSYTWGPATHEDAASGVTSTPAIPILCNGKEVLVTKNLFTFLQTAPAISLLASKSMWIDALCINQADLAERTSQVNIMATIYHSAEMVVVWLGEEDKMAGLTEKALKLVRAIGKTKRENEDDLKRVVPSKLGSEVMRAVLGESGDIEYWRAIAKLFRRNYFTRVWIVQEIALKKTAKAVCGRHVADWDDVVEASAFLTSTSWTRWICTQWADLPESQHAIPTILKAIEDMRKKDSQNSLLYSLIRTRRFLASDLRDKVYALLGVAGESVRGKARLSPEYDHRSLTETYVSAAIQILHDSKDLLLLACAEGDECRNIAGLPSWVPDWSHSRVLGLGVTGYTRFSAAGTYPRHMFIDEGPLTLEVKGLKLDDISTAGESKAHVLHGNPAPTWRKILLAMPETYHTGQPRVEVFWRTLITDTAGLKPQHPAPPEWGTAALARFKNGARTSGFAAADCRFPLDVPLTAAVESASSGEPAGSSAESLSEPKDSLEDEYEATFSHAAHLRLFATSKDYIGVGSESLRVGDQVWIVAGSLVPLILRPVSATPGSSYTVVGGAYLHGFMKGEALSGKPALEKIIIV